MSNWARSDEGKDDKAPHSRIFVVCSKELQEHELRQLFDKFGEIEDLYMLKDRSTGKSRGVAYIKYCKTSSAAAAIQEMHLKRSSANGDKPLKVMVATNKNDNNRNDNGSEKHNRLFIKVSKKTSDEEIKEYFSSFGELENIHVMRDKNTMESKGLAYVQYHTFLDAARAFEECDKQYKAVFAEPKQDLKRTRESRAPDNFNSYNLKDNFVDSYDRGFKGSNSSDINNLIKTPAQNFKTVLVTCSPQLPQRHIERLFSIIPGMIHCHYTPSMDFIGYCKAVIKYEDERAAAYAVEKLHNYEFPSGELISVKPENPLSQAATDLTNIVNSFKVAVDSGNPDLVQLADAIAQASTLIKVATSGRLDMKSEPSRSQDFSFCSVPLPPVQPLAPPTAQTVQRCFIVCKPHPPDIKVMRDVFSRFGDLIDIGMFPNKTYAFAMYASAHAAQEAIRTLHGATVCGVYLKVMEAKEQDRGNDSDHNESCNMDADRKRIRLVD